MSVYECIDEIHNLADKLIAKCTLVSASELALDERCGNLWFNQDCVVARKIDDARLQYYGGFEYIDKDERVDMIDYVVYLRVDDNRVDDCIRFYRENNSL